MNDYINNSKLVSDKTDSKTQILTLHSFVSKIIKVFFPVEFDRLFLKYMYMEMQRPNNSQHSLEIFFLWQELSYWLSRCIIHL